MLADTAVRKAIYESDMEIGEYKVILAHAVESIRSPILGVLSGLVTHVATIQLKVHEPNHTGQHKVYMMAIGEEIAILAMS
jgi:hypothetical protein